MSKTALIGATGLVGGTLLRQTSFDDHFHSRNIEDIRGRAYDLVVCAGAPAVKWLANKEPEADRKNLERLREALGAASASHVVLISTVDVYPDPVGVDETTPIDVEGHHAYGAHRRALERFVEERFSTTVVRLPGLFGKGLKKNVIFDLLHGKPLDGVDARSTFQFYDLERLWGDVERARAAGLALVNFPTEPVRVRAVAEEAFGVPFENRTEQGPIGYDMRTIHAEALGGRGAYLADADAVLAGIRAFVESEGWQRP